VSTYSFVEVEFYNVALNLKGCFKFHQYGQKLLEYEVLSLVLQFPIDLNSLVYDSAFRVYLASNIIYTTAEFTMNKKPCHELIVEQMRTVWLTEFSVKNSNFFENYN
jgi:hypothetical protein